MLALQVGEQDFLICQRGVADRQAHQEAVELGFGQGEGAFVLDRVLRGQHQERPRQAVGDAVHGDLLLLHGFQQGRLGARGGAVDLIDQQHVDEDRSLAELELPALLVEDRDAGDVVGQQVRGALQAVEVPAQADGQRSGPASSFQPPAHPRAGRALRTAWQP